MLHVPITPNIYLIQVVHPRYTSSRLDIHLMYNSPKAIMMSDPQNRSRNESAGCNQRAEGPSLVLCDSQDENIAPSHFCPLWLW